MPARRRPARAIAIAATEETHRRLLAIGVNCALAAIMVTALALIAL